MFNTQPPTGHRGFLARVGRHAFPAVGLLLIFIAAFAEPLGGLKLKDTDKAVLLLIPLVYLAARLSYRTTLLSLIGLALIVDFFFFRPLYAFGFHNPVDLIRFLLFLLVAALLGFWASWMRREMARRGADAENSERQLRALRSASSLTRQIANAPQRSNVVSLALDRIRGELGVDVVLLRAQGTEMQVVPTFTAGGAPAPNLPASFPPDQTQSHFPSGQWLLLPLATGVPHTLAIRVGTAFGRVSMDVVNLLTDLLSLAIDRQARAPD